MYWHDPVRVAVSLRVVETERYPERRDALAQDWATCLERWNVLPLLVPNRWRDPVQLVREWGAQALLLTGGNDVGKGGGQPRFYSGALPQQPGHGVQAVIIVGGLRAGLVAA